MIKNRNMLKDKILLDEIGIMIKNEQFVVCKKSIKNFVNGKKYKIANKNGDVQGSIEAQEKKMTTKFLNCIFIEDNEQIKVAFSWKGRSNHFSSPSFVINDFQDYFYITRTDERIHKFESILNRKNN